MNVVILGSTGMLGDAVAEAFEDFDGDVYLTSRGNAPKRRDSGSHHIEFDALKDSLDAALGFLKPGDFVINCIGIIKTEIDEASAASCERARQINSEFPARLVRFAEGRGFRVIQIATDCVFSGREGHYSETSLHDPVDVYGETKSAGEVTSENIMHLRVSIIGPEKRGFTSLFEWVSRQKPGAEITGYINHFWNGIPAKHFGKIARAVIEHDLFDAGVHHVLPADEVSKAELVRLIAARCGRVDIQITDGNAAVAVDRTLATNDTVFNAKIWAATGRATVPSVAELVAEI